MRNGAILIPALNPPEILLDYMEEEECTHVYLYKIDDAFIQRYNSAFSDSERIEVGRFFEIKTEENKKYLLKVED